MSYNSINKNIEDLEPTFRKKVKSFMKEVGHIIFIVEGKRTLERQKFLYGKGRSQETLIKNGFNEEEAKKFSDPFKSQVTRTLNSNHFSGQAIDIGFYGKELYPTDYNKWRKVADIAKKYHIDWGHDLWKTDKPHFQCNTLNTNNKIIMHNRTKKAVELGLIKVDENNIGDFINRNDLGAVLYSTYEKAKEDAKQEMLEVLSELYGDFERKMKEEAIKPKN